MISKFLMTLPLLQVDVVEQNTRSRPGWERCIIGTHIVFSTLELETYCFAPWKKVVYDAMLLAAAVEFCDRFKKRSTQIWARNIKLRIPVHEPDRWNAQEVQTSLIQALNLLTGDYWEIKFVFRKQAEIPTRQTQLPVLTGKKAIIPFSNGMDSQAVANLMEQQYGDGLIRLRINSKTLEKSTLRRSKEPFASVPFKVHQREYRFNESSARSRGFKFALISGLAAFLAESDTIIFPESGQGSLAPVLLVVGHAHADYRNHPVFTTAMEKFLLALLQYKVRYQFPRLWHTKGETLKTFIKESENTSAWQYTRSCWQQNRQVSVNRSQRQCGICAACMLRRMSVHAAGQTESIDTYVWENLSANTFRMGPSSDFDENKITKKMYDYAIAGTLHLDHLAGLRESQAHASLLKRNAFSLGEVLCLSEQETESRLNRLLKQHEDEWKSFLTTLSPDSFIREWVQVPL